MSVLSFLKYRTYSEALFPAAADGVIARFHTERRLDVCSGFVSKCSCLVERCLGVLPCETFWSVVSMRYAS